MNELLQKHGCSNVFSVPDGLKELMSDITREVLRWQPPKLYDFITNYLSALLITREHGILAVRIMDDLCDCRPSVSEHLLQIGVDEEMVDVLASIIKTEIESLGPDEGKEKVKETAILKKVLLKFPLDEEMSAKVCQVARNAYRDYWYRKSLLLKDMKTEPEEAWEKAAQHTLEIYKKTKPSISDLHRATAKIQAAYRGYHVRRNVLRHLQPKEKKKKPGRKVGIPGAPLDIAGSREISLGPVINIKVREDNVAGMFEDEAKAAAAAGDRFGAKYDPMTQMSHKDDDEFLEERNKKIQIGGKGIKMAPEFNIMDAIVSNSGPTAAEALYIRSHSQSSDFDQGYGMPTPFEVSANQRISFAESPPHLIRDPSDDEEPVPEVLDNSGESPVPPTAFEIPEELPADQMSSAPQSARTDIEDAAYDDDV